MKFAVVLYCTSDFFNLNQFCGVFSLNQSKGLTSESQKINIYQVIGYVGIFT